MDEPTIVKVAIFAVGGQGGGVLSNWIVQVAQSNGWAVQSTAVAGVAQRTGATFYYIEMAAPSARRPVFALAPSEGDVDIVIAAELMEAGRAIMRGFVTPDKTTLIASSHRMLAVSEKTRPGNGISSPADVELAATMASSKLALFDLEQVARQEGSVVSASLLGALAGTERLPFAKQSWLDTIAQSGRGVAASSRAFERGYDLAAGHVQAPSDATGRGSAMQARGPESLLTQWHALLARADQLERADKTMVAAGLRKVVDFQDVDYGAEYLQRLEQLAAVDPHGAFTTACARHLANALCYDDVIRVADLKTRRARSQRIQREYAGSSTDTLLQLTEFMHPRAQELVSLLPVKLAATIANRPRLMAWLDRRVNKGRRLRSDRLLPFLLLYLLGGLRRWRRSLARHQQEMQHIDDWLNQATELLPDHYQLAVEVINCRRLIKGYSDTHERGLSRFRMVMNTLPQLRRLTDPAAQMRALIEAALADAEGKQLSDKIATVATASGQPTAANTGQPSHA